MSAVIQENWITGADVTGKGRTRLSNGCLYIAPDGVPAYFSIAEFGDNDEESVYSTEDVARARLASAAPDMARAAIEAAKWLVPWTTEVYDEMSERFHRETGYTAPGKDSMVPCDEEISATAWTNWKISMVRKAATAFDAALRKAGARP